MRSVHGFRGSRPPDWWPEGEHWPPRGGPGAKAFGDFGSRMARRAALAVLGLIIVPLAAGVALAVTFGGWEAIGVAALVAVTILAVAALVLRLAARSFGPVRELIAATGRLADGDHSARVPEASSAALRPVVSSFNRMAERLEQAEDRRRRLIADVGHELRTPLTVIRGELESFVDGVHEPTEERVGELLEDVHVIERLLGDLETLSSAEAGTLPVHLESTDLVLLAESVVHNFSSSSPSVRLEARADAVPASVDPVRMREVLTNLINNAIAATSADGGVTVAVGVDGENAVLEVVDTGSGIDPREHEHVFDRFRKGPGSSGSGLGLTISRELVRAHGGAISVASEPGRGTTMEVRLPVERR